ncbi:MAG: hypothetical protein ACK559_16100, partial [bacterium]
GVPRRALWGRVGDDDELGALGVEVGDRLRQTPEGARRQHGVGEEAEAGLRVPRPPERRHHPFEAARPPGHRVVRLGVRPVDAEQRLVEQRKRLGREVWPAEHRADGAD